MREHEVNHELKYRIFEKVKAKNLFEAREAARKKAVKLDKMIRLISPELTARAEPKLIGLTVLSRRRINIDEEIEKLISRVKKSKVRGKRAIGEVLNEQPKRINELFGMSLILIGVGNEGRNFHYCGYEAMESAKSKKDKIGIITAMHIVVDFAEKVRELGVSDNPRNKNIEMVCNMGFDKMVEMASEKGTN